MSDTRKPASPPCELHEWQGDPVPGVADDIRAWRDQERKRLRALRREIGDAERLKLDERIGRQLDELLADVAGRLIAVYWPIKGEPALQESYAGLAGRGGLLALPVVVERDAPLEFRRWLPGAELGLDLLGIPAPDGEACETPDVIVTPVVGFDESGYRLGNGGGYYDRTLATLGARPLLVGVGYERCRLRSIYPQAHDWPMDHVVTEDGVRPAGA